MHISTANFIEITRDRSGQPRLHTIFYYLCIYRF